MLEHHSDAEIVRRAVECAALEELLRVDERFVLVCAPLQARGGWV